MSFTRMSIAEMEQSNDSRLPRRSPRGIDPVDAHASKRWRISKRSGREIFGSALAEVSIRFSYVLLLRPNVTFWLTIFDQNPVFNFTTAGAQALDRAHLPLMAEHVTPQRFPFLHDRAPAKDRVSPKPCWPDADGQRGDLRYTRPITMANFKAQWASSHCDC